MAGQAREPVGTEAEGEAGEERALGPRPQPAAQRIGGEGGGDEGRAHDEVGRSHEAQDRAQRYEEQAVEQGQRVQGETDPHRIEDVVGPQRVRVQVDEGLAHPPQVPDVDAGIAAGLAHVMGEEEVGQRPREQCRQRDVRERGQPGPPHLGRAEVRRRRSQSTATAASLPW